MRKIRNIPEIRNFIRGVKAAGKRIGFVPTMGALHQGHLALIRKARAECDIVVVSIFVNPLQFGPKDDFKKYPRCLSDDERLLAKEKVDILFLPGVNHIYKKNHSTYLIESSLSQRLCGKSRPGHFKGVCTIVAKLFNIVSPDKAYFGQKDYQQSLIIKRLVDNLNFSVKIVVVPIVRENDKLAMSSRNAYLSASERKESVCLYQGLIYAKRCIKSGETDSGKIIDGIKQEILSRSRATIDYIELVDPVTLLPVKKINDKVLVALAVYIGSTRLIDNMIINGKKN